MIIEFLIFLERYIINFVSVVFALFVLVEAIMMDAVIYIFLGLPLVLINFFLSKKFPNRFYPYSWQGIKIGHIIFSPPISTLIMSGALIIFVSSFFEPTARKIWISSLKILPNLTGNIGLNLFAFFIFFPLIVILPILTFFGIMKLLKKKTDIDSNKILFYCIIFPTAVLYTYLIAKFIDAIAGNDIIGYSGNIIAFIVGFIPLHWFYAIFIGNKNQNLGRS